MPRIANRDARRWVQNLWSFEGSNLEGVGCYIPGPRTRSYAVFSFGRHWPLFVHYNDVWYENIEKYSRTTSKHHSQVHPGCETIPCTTQALLDLIAGRGAPRAATEADLVFA
jgi:hypothetical protein